MNAAAADNNADNKQVTVTLLRSVHGQLRHIAAVHHLLDEALKQVGDQYVFGAEVDVNDPDPKVWDCAELTKWAAHQGGSTIPGSSFEQYLDLKAKGLLDETLVIWHSEFGRMPLSENGVGRDHNPGAMTIWMAGTSALRRWTHSMPSIPAMWMSMSTTSGRSAGRPCRAASAVP